MLRNQVVEIIILSKEEGLAEYRAQMRAAGSNADYFPIAWGLGAPPTANLRAMDKSALMKYTSSCLSYINSLKVLIPKLLFSTNLSELKALEMIPIRVQNENAIIQLQADVQIAEQKMNNALELVQKERSLRISAVEEIKRRNNAKKAIAKKKFSVFIDARGNLHTNDITNLMFQYMIKANKHQPQGKRFSDLMLEIWNKWDQPIAAFVQEDYDIISKEIENIYRSSISPLTSILEFFNNLPNQTQNRMELEPFMDYTISALKFQAFELLKADKVSQKIPWLERSQAEQKEMEIDAQQEHRGAFSDLLALAYSQEEKMDANVRSNPLSTNLIIRPEPVLSGTTRTVEDLYAGADPLASSQRSSSSRTTQSLFSFNPEDDSGSDITWTQP